MNKIFYWLKLKNDFFTDVKIKRLRKIAGGDTYTIIYQKLLLLSLANNGNIFFEENEDNFSDFLSLAIDENEDNISVTLSYLEKAGLLLTHKDCISLPAIQSLTGSETIDAVRKREYRSGTMSQKNGTMSQKNGTMSHQCPKNVLPEKEIEKEIRDRDQRSEIEILTVTKEANKKVSINPKRAREGTKVEEYDMKDVDETVQKTLLDFIEMRKSMNCKLTQQAYKLLILALKKLSDSPSVQKEILEQSILNGWKGVFAVRKQRALETASKTYEDAERLFYIANPSLKKEL